jgi:hypothetical protein
MEIIPGRYQHFKGGLYKVTGVAKHSETLEPLVIYVSEKDGGVWARPLEMFTDTVEGDQLRFKRIAPETSKREE